MCSLFIQKATVHVNFLHENMRRYKMRQVNGISANVAHVSFIDIVYQCAILC